MDINISHDKIIINPLWQKWISQHNDEAYAYINRIRWKHLPVPIGIRMIYLKWIQNFMVLFTFIKVFRFYCKISFRDLFSHNMVLSIYKNTNYKNKCLHTSEIHNLVGNIMVYQKLSLMIYYMATPTIFHATKVSFLLCVMYNWWFH